MDGEQPLPPPAQPRGALGPGLLLFVAALLGAFCGLFLGAPAWAWAVTASAAAVIAVLAKRQALSAFAVFAAVLLIVAASAAQTVDDHRAHAPVASDGPTLFEGIVQDVVPSRYGGRTLIVHGASTTSPTELTVRARLAPLLDGFVVAPGDRIRFRATLHRFFPRDRPGTFDAELYAIARGFDARAGVYQSHDIVVTERGAETFVFADARAFLRRRLLGLVSARKAGVVLALLVGDTALFDEDQLLKYRDIGAGHLLAVSGLQVSLLALIFFYLIKCLLLLTPFGRRRLVSPIAAGFSLVAVAGFVLLCGAPPSCVRAGLMAGAVLVGAATGHPVNGINALTLAGLATVAFAPASVIDPSFLLSYAAVLGLLLAAPVNQTAPPTLRRRAAELLLPTFGAGALTLGISAHLFGAFAPGGIPANIILVPVATALQVPAIFLGLLGALTSSTVIADLGAMSAGLLEAITFGLADIMGGVVDVPAPGGVATLLFMIGAAALVWGVAQSRLAPVLIALVFFALPLVPALLPQSGVVIEVLPVGQGDSHFVRFPSGQTMLIDGGGVWDESRKPGRDVVVPYLKAHHVERVDVMVLSHPDPDHLLGLLDVLEAIPVGELWHSGYGDEHPLMRRLLASAHAHDVVVKRAADLREPMRWGDTALTVLAPFPEDGALLYDELTPNENSLVLHVAHHGASMLFAGDVERWAERYLVERGAPVRANILKAGHHGSKTSSTAAFIDAVAPEHVLFTTGRGNQFGFPHREVTTRFRALGIAQWDTAIHGLIRIVLDDHAVSITPFHDVPPGEKSARQRP